jgi:ribosomal protein L21E
MEPHLNKFKVGDKVIFQLRSHYKRGPATKIYIGIVNKVSSRFSFPYSITIEGRGADNLARENELTLWTPLFEALC